VHSARSPGINNTAFDRYHRIYRKRLRLVFGISQSMARSPSVCQPYIRFLCVDTLSLLMLLSDLQSPATPVRLSSRPKPCHSLTLPSNSACTRTCILLVVWYARHTKKTITPCRDMAFDEISFNYLITVPVSIVAISVSTATIVSTSVKATASSVFVFSARASNRYR